MFTIHFASLTIGDRAWILPAMMVAIVGILLALLLNRRRLAE